MLAQMTHLVEQYGAEIELLRAPLLEISSTAIRSRARNNLSVYYMVPDTVAEYIVKNELYQMRG